MPKFQNLKRRRKQREEKYWKMKRTKNDKYSKSKKITVNTFGFTFYTKIIFCSKI